MIYWKNDCNPESLRFYRIPENPPKYQGEDWLQIEPADREADTVKWQMLSTEMVARVPST